MNERTVLIFLLAITLRISLALVNQEANDNHIEVIQRILQGNPIKYDSCWECYQPKLYHLTVAFFTSVFSMHPISRIIIFSQLLNVIVGIGTLFFLYFFIKAQKVSGMIKELTFAFVALN